jgi:hypothetical protein
MENSSKRSVGRPKATQQTGPLVLQGSRARTKIEVELPEATAEELNEYARWVELSGSLATKDALFATVDYALHEVFRRDRLWQERRRKGAESTSVPMPVAPPPATTNSSPNLPPPTHGARAVPTPPAPPGAR